MAGPNPVRAGTCLHGARRMVGYSAVVPADARPAPVVLGSWPTPLEPAPRLAAAVGLAADALWVKRDSSAGLGGGGNKVRKRVRVRRDHGRTGRRARRGRRRHQAPRPHCFHAHRRVAGTVRSSRTFTPERSLRPRAGSGTGASRPAGWSGPPRSGARRGHVGQCDLICGLAAVRHHVPPWSAGP